MVKNSLPKVSVIIICEEWNDFLEESLPYYDKLDYRNFEVIVFSTKPIEGSNPTSGRTRLINNDKIKHNPAEKRDKASTYATGEIYAFIDDDAFPTKDWLNSAVKHFQDKNVAGVGGPGITPHNASILEKSSGWVSASPFGGFATTHRFIPTKEMEVDDFPTMNLLIRAEDFKKIGGFDSNFYPGEDTKLCLDLTKKLKKKIIYDPAAGVYHHKRPLFKKHLIQNGRFGLHRGHFARVLPETSRRLFYFVPALFSIGVIGGLLLTLLNYFFPIELFQILVKIYLFIMSIYTISLILNSVWILIKSKSIPIALLTIPGVFLTHLWYGLKFVQGYFKKQMLDKYGRVE